MNLILWFICSVIVVFGFVVFRGAPYVPSKQKDVARALDELYPIGNADTLVDIGSGDGRVLREAARRGARAVGYELNPLLVIVSRWLSRADPLVTVSLADFWRTPLPMDTTVVYVFGDSRDIIGMAQKVADAAVQFGRPMALISYGIAVPGMSPAAQAGAHFLYRMEPLQKNGA